MFSHITPKVWLENESEMRKSVLSFWDAVPLIDITNIKNLPDQRLVRFRGMVQDTLNPEYYLKLYEVYDKVDNEKKMRTMKFQDEVVYDEAREDFSSTNPNHVFAHRHACVISTIPGFNQWEQSIEQNVGLSIATSPTPKRSIDDVELIAGESSSTSDIKKQCTSKTQIELDPTSFFEILGIPIWDNKCFLLLYDNDNTLKVTDLVEAVGFISRTEGPAIRIHCVTFKHINHCNLMTYGNRLLNDRYPSYKNDLHFVLSQLLLGDRLAAEYLIYHLISRIYTRNDVFPIGKFCLNISEVPSSILDKFGKGVYEFIELIVPTSLYVPMTLGCINARPFYPKKNYATDALNSGILQVAKGTHIVLDETSLETGRLNKWGIAAMKALNTAIVYQKIPYDFLNYSIDIECDIPFLTISQGRSLLPSDHRVCLEPDETCLSSYPDTLAAAKTILKGFINEIRLYLTQARDRDLQFSDDIMMVIQNDFVRLRRTRSFVADDLHRLLVLSRLIAISDGKTVLDVMSWNRACELDEIRARRIQP